MSLLSKVARWANVPEADLVVALKVFRDEPRQSARKLADEARLAAKEWIGLSTKEGKPR
jgi:hypothetical protein